MKFLGFFFVWVGIFKNHLTISVVPLKSSKSNLNPLQRFLHSFTSVVYCRTVSNIVQEATAKNDLGFDLLGTG